MKTIILTSVATLLAFFCVVSCSKKAAVAPTEISFYLPQDCGVGPVAITLNGSTQNATIFFPNGTPTCGQSGTVTFTVPAGNYTMTAKGGNITWNVAVFAVSGLCNLYALTCSGGGGTTGGNNNYYYANWSCNGQSQCIADMGANNGSDGPFCTKNDCQAWGNKFIPGAYSCATAPNTTPVLGGTPPNGNCFQIGDF